MAAVADAVLTQRLLVGGAAVAGLCLIVLLLITAFWLLASIANRLRQANAQCERILAEAAEPAPTRAVLDTEPGVNLADLDKCALILAATNEHEAALEAGRNRLLAAIRDEQQKGETT